MLVAVYDENLMWSAKLSSGIKLLGFEVMVLEKLPESLPESDVAIINLGSAKMPPETVIPLLKDRGIKIIAHAGHKEKPVLDLGNEYGADLVVTNSELTHKLGDILAKFV